MIDSMTTPQIVGVILAGTIAAFFQLAWMIDVFTATIDHMARL